MKKTNLKNVEKNSENYYIEVLKIWKVAEDLYSFEKKTKANAKKMLSTFQKLYLLEDEATPARHYELDYHLTTQLLGNTVIDPQTFRTYRKMFKAMKVLDLEEIIDNGVRNGFSFNKEILETNIMNIIKAGCEVRFEYWNAWTWL